MAKPWAEAGYDCYCLDINNDDSERDGIRFCYADLTEDISARQILKNLDVAFMAAFPPCDHLAISGSRWMKGKGLRALEWSIAMFATSAELCEDSDAPYCIENPMSTISTYWREPDHKFNPSDFIDREPADNYSKETWLWTGNGFRMPAPVMPSGLFAQHETPDDRIWRAPPGPNRKAFRSATPNGFAIAAFEANSTKHRERQQDG
ncbi:MAG: hypothetical protein OER56_03920 [Hyphomicrobiales bacterium]|nr:hypothetical protein [Hyphomicrobiales bacterium]